MYQKTVIIGRLGKDPDMRFTPTGTAVCEFSVAVDRQYKGADGKPVKETDWFKVTTWNKLAETCNTYLSKGKLVLAEGRVQAEAWKDKESGEAKAGLKLTADTVKFLSAKDDAAPEPAPFADVPF